jgi:hypothetical protein
MHYVGINIEKAQYDKFCSFYSSFHLPRTFLCWATSAQFSRKVGFLQVENLCTDEYLCLSSQKSDTLGTGVAY